MASLFTSIDKTLPSMTKSMRKVASYYLGHLNTLALSNLDTTAHDIGVSTTTIIRFARMLGYSGFTELQKVVQSELLKKVRLPERLMSLQSSTEFDNHLLIDSMHNDIDNITKTLSQLDLDEMNKIVHSINDAHMIYVLGMRSSFALAHYATSRLAQIRPYVRLVEGSGMLFPEAFGGCNSKDVCIAFSFPRYSKTTINLLTWLKKKNCKVILFTSTNNEEVAKFGDMILPCYLSSVSFKNSIAAPISLINYISAAVAVLGHERAIDTVKDTEDFLEMGNYLDK